MGVFWVSLFVGRYPLDHYTIIIILFAKISDIVISILSLPSQFFMPYVHTVPPVTEKISFFFEGLTTLVHPVPVTWTSTMETVVWQVRFPRTLAVILVGAGLAVSGATFQSTFRNPLVSENILGVSSGAAVGASIGILMGQGPLVIEILAFCVGIFAVILTFFISRVYKSNPLLVLVLAGIIVGSLFSAVLSIIKYVADPSSKLPDIVYWLMGSFSKVSLRDVCIITPIIIVCVLIIFLVRWRLNVLSMGEEEAKALGLDTGKFRRGILVCATLITAASVSICGMIGWIGLVIPHLTRMIIGPDHQGMIPATILLGASFLLIVDILCRTITLVEIPISIIMSFVGAPLFLYLLRTRVSKSWSG